MRRPIIGIYRCYFVQNDGATVAWRVVQSESEREAYDHALGLFVGCPAAETLELWDNKRLVFSYRRSDAKSPAEMRRLCHLAIAAASRERDQEVKQTVASCAFALAQEAESLERLVSDARHS
jgi:hypothetical protein